MVAKYVNKALINTILRAVYLKDNEKEVLKIYQFCTEGDNLGFLMIDLCAKEEHQFRLNFLQVLNINFFK